MQSEKTITEFNARFLQDSRSWILMPTQVDYYISSDNITFTLAGSTANTLDPKETENRIVNFRYLPTNPIQTRYVKVKAHNFGTLPEWHQGAGGEAFIFVDEITIK